MGLLDGLLGGMLGGSSSTSGGTAQAQAQPGQSALIGMALQLIQQNGGLPAIIGKLQQAGLGQQVGSWVGTGKNIPVDPNQLTQALGSGTIGQLAQQLGVSHGEAGTSLAQMLPHIIDQMTPQGQVPDNHGDMLAQALSMLKTRTG